MNNNNDSSQLTIMDIHSLKDKIYVVRGVQVMLDFDLADIYGYTTKAFNQQVKNNIIKFPDDFRFRLTAEEVSFLSRSKKLTAMQAQGMKGGRTSLPYAFTESGIYMLMTVLRGELATRQSIKLIRLFKQMKDCLVDNPAIAVNQQLLSISAQTSENAMAIKRIEGSMVSHDDLNDFIKLFDQGIQNEEYLILDGKPFTADAAYQKIYRIAKKSIIIIDDYIGVKTLHHLASARDSVEITVISDNKGKYLRKAEYDDFQKEYPSKTIRFVKSDNRSHDRYIILDNGLNGMKVYLCGASSKDAGKRITTITRLSETAPYKELIKTLLKNEDYILK